MKDVAYNGQEEMSGTEQIQALLEKIAPSFDSTAKEIVEKSNAEATQSALLVLDTVSNECGLGISDEHLAKVFEEDPSWIRCQITEAKTRGCVSTPAFQDALSTAQAAVLTSVLVGSSPSSLEWGNGEVARVSTSQSEISSGFAMAKTPRPRNSPTGRRSRVSQTAESLGLCESVLARAEKHFGLSRSQILEPRSRADKKIRAQCVKAAKESGASLAGILSAFRINNASAFYYQLKMVDGESVAFLKEEGQPAVVVSGAEAGQVETEEKPEETEDEVPDAKETTASSSGASGITRPLLPASRDQSPVLTVVRTDQKAKISAIAEKVFEQFCSPELLVSERWQDEVLLLREVVMYVASLTSPVTVGAVATTYGLSENEVLLSIGRITVEMSANPALAKQIRKMFKE